MVADFAAGGPARVLVGLMWNDSDVAAVLGSLLGEGDVPEQMELPRRLGPSFDQVLVAGQPVGVSTGRTVSPHLRAMISLCVVDREHSTPGTELVVIWGRQHTTTGDPGDRHHPAVQAGPPPDRRHTAQGSMIRGDHAARR
ncbi:hypothetical protein [Actinophytocola sp.]|uniref:hypothetical protein n=1 Tax=Actinophytocola sp. TaxID=1872138 RepID=UPI002ED04183